MRIIRSHYLWSVDPDSGRIWVAHQCGPFLAPWERWQLPSPWRLDDDGRVTPSLDCQACGAHEFLGHDQRITWQELLTVAAA